MPSSWFQPSLSPTDLSVLLKLLGEIDEFKGHWRKLREIRAEQLDRLRQITTIESAGSSTRIEGAELSNDEVARVLEGLHVDSFRARDESEVRGYAELLQTIFDDYREIPLEERFIKQLHGILLRHSDADAWHRGRYKTNDNHVEARHPDGRVEIVFRTATPFDTPRRMNELVRETTTALGERAAHPLLVIARFVVDFLAVHPFQDGNGRLSRGLTSLLLLRAGYEYVPYSSLERVVEENKAAYYTALRASQMAMRERPHEFGAWLLFFLRALRTQQEVLVGKLDVERTTGQLSEVQERILAVVDRHGSVTSTMLATALQLAARTVRYHLDALIHHGLIQPTGEKRGRIYRRATGTPARMAEPDEAAGVLVAILEGGGRTTAAGLRRLVKRQGADARLAGTLHGKRTPYLRRDARTGDSMLTRRGREVAERHVITQRLACQRSDG